MLRFVVSLKFVDVSDVASIQEIITLMMEAVPFETSINFYETTRLSIPYILAALRT
jgi:hypothetical protein